MKTYQETVKECISFAKRKEYGVKITEDKITFDNIKGYFENEKVFNFIEDTFYHILKKENSEIEKYLISNNETEVSVQVYFKD